MVDCWIQCCEAILCLVSSVDRLSAKAVFPRSDKQRQLYTQVRTPPVLGAPNHTA